MAKLETEFGFNERTLELIESTKQQEQIRTLVSVFVSDLGGLKDYVIPKEYKRRYGIDNTSYLSSLLEAYHQLRLQDK